MKFLAAVSGGADSMAMLAALYAVTCKEALFCLHVEHGIRAEESCADAGFVRDYCEKLGINCRVVSIPPGKIASFARRKGTGLEAAARHFRRKVLFRHAARLGEKTLILTAHTMDDMLETALMRVLRGAGPAGLAAMPVTRGRVLRPLLSMTRADVIGYLAEKKIPWREDSTNKDEKFLRNRIRLRLVPLLSESFPSWKSGVANMAQTQSLAADFIGGEAKCRVIWEIKRIKPRRTRSYTEEEKEIKLRSTQSYAEEEKEVKPRRARSYAEEEKRIESRSSRSCTEEDKRIEPRSSRSYTEEDKRIEPRSSRSYTEEDKRIEPRRARSYAEEEKEIRPLSMRSYAEEEKEIKPRSSRSYAEEDKRIEPRSSRSYTEEEKIFISKTPRNSVTSVVNNSYDSDCTHSFLSTNEENFFAQPEIIREEALFLGIDLLLAGAKNPRPVRRSVVRRFCAGLIAAADLGPLVVKRVRGNIVLTAGKKGFSESGFSVLIKEPGFYNLKNISIEVCPSCGRGRENSFYALLPFVLRKSFKDDFLVSGGKKMARRNLAKNLISAVDANGTAAFIGAQGILFGRDTPQECDKKFYYVTLRG